MTPRAVEPVETDGSADAALLQPFDEQTSLDVAAGRRRLFALRTSPDGAAAGSAVLGDGALDLFIAPALRARGLGEDALRQLLEHVGAGPLTAWSHEDHPAARALAARFGFAGVRTLLQLRTDLTGLAAGPAPDDGPTGRPAPGAERTALAGASIMAFRPGVDDAEWVALNARVFAWHAEQGGITREDLAERLAEPWFRSDDFLVARGDAGAMVGYCWLKVEGPVGEIYVVGVAPEASGRGLGRALLTAGLSRLRERGCETAELYVESDNANAVHLYRALGFVDAQVHVQYARVTG